MLDAAPPVVPPDLLAGLLAVETLEAQARAVAGRAPAVLRVVGEEARVEVREAAAAPGQARRVEYTTGVDTGRPREPRGRSSSACSTPLPRSRRPRDGFRERFLRPGRHLAVGHGQLDGVLLEPVEPRPGTGRHERAVHAQLREPAGRGPRGEIGVVALAGDHERGEQRDPLPPQGLHDPGQDGFLRLRLDRHAALRAVLHAELHEEQAQEVVDLGQRGDRALPAAAAGALLDGHRRRHAEHAVHVGPVRRAARTAGRRRSATRGSAAGPRRRGCRRRRCSCRCR